MTADCSELPMAVLWAMRMVALRAKLTVVLTAAKTVRTMVDWKALLTAVSRDSSWAGHSDNEMAAYWGYQRVAHSADSSG